MEELGLSGGGGRAWIGASGRGGPSGWAWGGSSGQARTEAGGIVGWRVAWLGLSGRAGAGAGRFVRTGRSGLSGRSGLAGSVRHGLDRAELSGRAGKKREGFVRAGLAGGVCQAGQGVGCRDGVRSGPFGHVKGGEVWDVGTRWGGQGWEVRTGAGRHGMSGGAGRAGFVGFAREGAPLARIPDKKEAPGASRALPVSPFRGA